MNAAYMPAMGAASGYKTKRSKCKRYRSAAEIVILISILISRLVETIVMATKKKLRQFQCNHCGGRTWFERAARSQCRKCKNDGTPIPRGEEIGVFACKFKCDCGNEYTVLCEMTDTAECYACKAPGVSPYEFWPRQYIKKKSDNVHSCSKCEHLPAGGCPNLRKVSGSSHSR